MSVDEAEFTFLKEQTGATSSNLGKRQCTICRITPEGTKAFSEYVGALRDYIHK